ncbi:hypothetical protein QWZ08_24945 [Ferruginibacter paludis]|uniref:hypothetical protein n=1 Tax=Ferruginibacter paludis TaxID=1310417 RepID=UPI0025B3B63D|nr:hypothetical protein [Ferruginibacter paludis]MDN3658915.1 hypothetical protein [Ferruginibacter paludis]
MKRLFFINGQKIIFTFILVFFAIPIVIGQCPDPTNPDCGGDPGGPGVPLTGADILLLVMAACYVIFKVWPYRKKVKLSASDIS